MTSALTNAGLPAEVLRHHRAFVSAASKGLDHARQAGELLLQIKQSIEHGYWLAWLREYCAEITPRTAQTYMRVAERWPQIKANAKRVAHLSFRQSLALIADARNKDAEATEPEAEARATPEAQSVLDQLLEVQVEEDLAEASAAERESKAAAFRRPERSLANRARDQIDALRRIFADMPAARGPLARLQELAARL